MISIEELSLLLGALYAAPLEPEKWQVFMDRLCGLADVSCGYLIAKYAGDGSALLAGGGAGFDPEMFRLYNEYYSARDPYVSPILANPQTGLIVGDELVDRMTLVKTEVYNDFLMPYDLESTNVLMCNCNQEKMEGLSLCRGPKQGAMDRESQRLLETIFPHLQMALQVRTKVLEYDAANRFSETALDALSIATLLVSGDGRLHHMNRQAAAYLRNGEGLQLLHGRLVANNSLEAAQLEQLLRAATRYGGSNAELPPGGAMRILRPASRSQLQVTVIPAPEQSLLAGKQQYALVFLSDLSSVSGSRATLMRQLYRLTPAECRLADLLLEGLDVREAAERLRITLETARFHLKRVLSKTGARRQTELMRLMLSLPACIERVKGT
jgi:DNA-binding CsgD family transcriptional regulator